MYTDQISHCLGCESTIPSKIVLPRSASPSLYSSCANLDIVLRSNKQSCSSNTHMKTSTYVSLSGGFAERAITVCVHSLLTRAEGSIRRITSKLLSFGRTFCMFACIALPLSVRCSERGFRQQCTSTNLIFPTFIKDGREPQMNCLGVIVSRRILEDLFYSGICTVYVLQI